MPQHKSMAMMSVAAALDAEIAEWSSSAAAAAPSQQPRPRSRLLRWLMSLPQPEGAAEEYMGQVAGVLRRIRRQCQSGGEEAPPEALEGFSTAEEFVEGVVAIALYSGHCHSTNGSLSFAVNAALDGRSGNRQQLTAGRLAPLVEVLQHTLQRLPKKKNVLLFRGMKHDGSISATTSAAIITKREFLSATGDCNVARNFAAGGGVGEQLWVVRAASVADVSFATVSGGGESEFLFPPGTQFTVAFVMPDEALRMLNTRSRIAVLQQQSPDYLATTRADGDDDCEFILRLKGTFSALLQLSTTVFVDPLVDLTHPRFPSVRRRAIAEFFASDFKEGDRAVLLGAAGSGKSTLLFEMFSFAVRENESDCGRFAVHVFLRLVPAAGRGGRNPLDAAVMAMLSLSSQFTGLTSGRVRVALFLDGVDEAPHVVTMLHTSKLVSAAATVVASVRPEWLRQQESATLRDLSSWFGCPVFELTPCDLQPEDIDAYIHKVSVAEAITLQRAFQVNDANVIPIAVRTAERRAVCPIGIEESGLADDIALVELISKYTDSSGYAQQVVDAKVSTIVCCIHPVKGLIRTPLEMWLAISAHRALEDADSGLTVFELYRRCLLERTRRELKSRAAATFTAEDVERHAYHAAVFSFFKDETSFTPVHEDLANLMLVRRCGGGVGCTGRYEFSHKLFHDFYTALGLLELNKGKHWAEVLSTFKPIAAGGVATMLTVGLQHVSCTSWWLEALILLRQTGAAPKSILAHLDRMDVSHSSVQDKIRFFSLKGSLFLSLGKLKGNLEMCERAWEVVMQSGVRDNKMFSVALQNLAGAYRSLDEPHKSIQLLERYIGTVVSNSSNNDTLEVAETLNSLGIAFGVAGNHQRQKELLEKVLAIKERCLGRDHPEVASVLDNLAGAYYETGNRQKAIDTMTRALAIAESHYGPDSTHVATILNNLATDLGAHPKSKELIERALAITRHHYGDAGHPSIAAMLSNLSVFAPTPQKKKEMLEQALAIARLHFGPRNPQLAAILSNLGVSYGDVGDLLKKRELLQEALQIDQEAFGVCHRQVAIALKNLATTYDDVGTKISLLERVVEIAENTLGPTHLDVAVELSSLASAHSDAGNFKKAEEMLNRALRIQENHYGHDAPQIVEILDKIAFVCCDLGDHERERQIRHRVLAIVEGRCGPTHLSVGGALNNLAMSYACLGDVTKKKELLGRACCILEAHLGPDHPHVRGVRSNFE